MGVKDIASWLNAPGFRGRNDIPFCLVHAILTRSAYPGVHDHNTRDGRTERLRAKSGWVAEPVPQIVSPDGFDRVQELLLVRRPNMTPPRITNSEVLPSELVRRESCGDPMLLRTGTSKTGRTHRYYSCAGRMLKGRSVCSKPISVPEAQLDQLLTTTRLSELLGAATKQQIRAKIEELTARRDECAGLLA